MNAEKSPAIGMNGARYGSRSGTWRGYRHLSKEFPHSVVRTTKCRTFISRQNNRVESIPIF